MMMCSMFWPVLVVLLAGLGTAQVIDSQMKTYRASKYQDIVLPCGPDNFMLDGPDAFVLWVKENGDVVYKYPDDRYSRYFRECIDESCFDNKTLLIQNVDENDAGTYTCRVHFQGSPATYYTMRLVVVGSSGQPVIYNETGVELHDIVGPLELGDDLALVCLVPEEYIGTQVWWQRNGVNIPALSMKTGSLHLVIRVNNITRDELDATYTCTSKNIGSRPLTATVVVKMILLPLSVKISLDGNMDFKPDEPRVVDCVVIGCAPPPTVIWSLGGRILDSNIHTERYDGEYTVSSLTLIPELKDHHSRLTCQARNDMMPETVLEDSVYINVGFRPSCVLPGIMKIGTVDGQFETATCIIKAYPKPQNFAWHFGHSGPLYTAPTSLNGRSDLFMSNFTWKHSSEKNGEAQNLICEASNDFGMQHDPCKFAIVKGGPPEQPKCSATAQDNTLINVSCSETWNGGRPATVHLEVRNLDDEVLQDYTDGQGKFQLGGPLSTANMTVVVYASSVRGRSTSTILTIPEPTAAPPSKDTDTPPFWVPVKWEIIILVVIIGFCILIGAQSYNAIRKCMPCHRQNQSSIEVTYRSPSEDYDSPSVIPLDNEDVVTGAGIFHREPELPEVVPLASRAVTFVRATADGTPMPHRSALSQCMPSLRTNQPNNQIHGSPSMLTYEV